MTTPDASARHTQTEQTLRAAQHGERWQLLRALDRLLEGPLVVLAFVWLGVLVLEFVLDADARLDLVFYAIWVVFIVEVLIELVIAPSRTAWLRANWLKVAALALPALRVLRVVSALRFLRAAQAVRSASLLRLLTSLSRGIGALGRALDQARFAYVVAISALVIVVGAAGMVFFESSAGSPAAPQGDAARIASYGEALWWTAMTMTTAGSQYEPLSAEGRLLGWLLSVYALGVFGYVTATIASYFLGLGRAPADAAAGADVVDELSALRDEIARLRIDVLSAPQSGRPADG